MRLIVSIILLLPTLLLADIYEEYQLSTKGDLSYKQDYFFEGEFDEIIRFKPLIFAPNTLGNDLNKTLEYISKKSNSYKDSKRKFYISIIGHSDVRIEDENEKRIESDTYVNKIQNILRDFSDINESIALSRKNAQKVKKYLLKQGIAENNIGLEYRDAKDQLYSGETQESRDLSRRVMVTLYVEENLDLDRDGVVNSRDFCPDTKAGVVVDRDGCKFKTLILLAENKKNNNAIEISTVQGSRLIDTPRDYTFIKSKNDTPKLYKSMPKERINQIFSDVVESHDVTTFTIYFNNADFINEQAQFSKIIKFLSQKEDAYIQIIGHTDTKGSFAFNNKLAQKRAEIVAQKIIESGVKYLYMEVNSYSEHNLAVKTPDGVSEAMNRRVEVLIR